MQPVLAHGGGMGILGMAPLMTMGIFIVLLAYFTKKTAAPKEPPEIDFDQDLAALLNSAEQD